MSNRATRRGSSGAMDADIYTLLAAIPLWFGVDLLRPESTFATSQAWTVFAGIASETSWGVAFLVISAVGWMGMLTDRRTLKLASLYVLALALLATACLFAIGSPLSTGSGTYALVGFLAYRFVRHVRRMP